MPPELVGAPRAVRGQHEIGGDALEPVSQSETARGGAIGLPKEGG